MWTGIKRPEVEKESGKVQEIVEDMDFNEIFQASCTIGNQGSNVKFCRTVAIIGGTKGDPQR